MSVTITLLILLFFVISSLFQNLDRIELKTIDQGEDILKILEYVKFLEEKIIFLENMIFLIREDQIEESTMKEIKEKFEKETDEIKEIKKEISEKISKEKEEEKNIENKKKNIDN